MSEEIKVKGFLKCPKCGKDTSVRPEWYWGRFVSLEFCGPCGVHRTPGTRQWADSPLPPSPPPTFVDSILAKKSKTNPERVIETYYAPRE